MASWPTLLPIRSLPFSSCSSSFDNSASPFYYYYYSHIHQSMLLFLFIFTLSLSFLSVLILSLHSKRINYNPIKSLIKQIQKISALYEASVDNINNNDDNNKDQMDKQLGHGSSPTRLIRTILLEVLPSDSPKSADIFKGDGPYKNGLAMDGEGGFGEEDEEEDKKKKRKKRAKKKRPDSNNGAAGEGKTKKDNKKEELVCLYPFKTSSSAIQRKIKQQYDQLVKSHESNGLTLAQVGQFVNSLVEAKKELQHRSEVIQRKFTITKALLLKADRSSFDRLRQQIYKLELEQKRLEEDAFVYNWLQQQLKFSSAYKKMLEIGACMEMEDKPHKQIESIDNEFSDISFEELLAQEKKDAFWQRNGRSRSYSVSGQRFC